MILARDLDAFEQGSTLPKLANMALIYDRSVKTDPTKWLGSCFSSDGLQKITMCHRHAGPARANFAKNQRQAFCIYQPVERQDLLLLQRIGFSIPCDTEDRFDRYAARLNDAVDGAHILPKHQTLYKGQFQFVLHAKEGAYIEQMFWDAPGDTLAQKAIHAYIVRALSLHP